MKRVEATMPPSGIDAKNQAEADRVLNWACTTRDANGKWHRVTIALSRVPVCELYNVISNTNFIAQRLRELSADVAGHPMQRRIEQEATNIERLRELLQQRDSVNGTPIVLDPTLHIHNPKPRDAEEESHPSAPHSAPDNLEGAGGTAGRD